MAPLTPLAATNLAYVIKVTSNKGDLFVCVGNRRTSCIKLLYKLPYELVYSVCVLRKIPPGKFGLL